MTTWGESIPHDGGEKPVWLAGDTLVSFVDHCGATYGDDVTLWTAGEPEMSGEWATLRSFRLPADHWAYAPIRAGFTPWEGGESAPDDWDGTADVFYADGKTETYRYPDDWTHTGGTTDIIGYKRRKDEQPEAVRRALALVERIAASDLSGTLAEAQAILALLKPVDPIEAEARRLFAIAYPDHNQAFVPEAFARLAKHLLEPK